MTCSLLINVDKVLSFSSDPDDKIPKTCECSFNVLSKMELKRIS